jgi:hypothetical protein
MRDRDEEFIPQFRNFHLGALRQPMPGRDGRHQPLAVQHGTLQIGIGAQDGEPRQSDIGAAFDDLAGLVFGWGLGNLQRNAGKSFSTSLSVGPAARSMARNWNAAGAAPCSPLPMVGPGPRHGQVEQYPAAARIEVLAGLGQFEGLGIALEQDHVEVGLQFLDLRLRADCAMNRRSEARV